MTLDDVRDHCLRLDPGVSEDMPFGDDVLVFRTSGKIFLLANLTRMPFQINVKCDPERALELRERYTSVIPGYHMNKKHWNTVILDGTVPAREVREMIDHSFGLVRPKQKRPRKGRR